MTQDGLFLFLGHKIAIIPKTLRCFCFVQHARGPKKKTKKFFYPIFVLVHFWRYVHFRGRSGAQENLYFRRRWLRKFSNFTDVTNNENYFLLFDRSEKNKKNLFSSNFCSNALLEIRRFPGSKRSSRKFIF